MTEKKKTEDFAKKFKKDPKKSFASNIQGGFSKDKILKSKAPKNQESQVEQMQEKKTRDIKEIIAKQKQKANNNRSYKEKLRRSRRDCVFLVTGKDSTVTCSQCEALKRPCNTEDNICRQEAWHYVLVDPQKKNLFISQTKTGSINVSDFGEVIKSGWGRTPSEENKNEIENMFEE